jgi:CMP-N-acetylneuraminic acid synthetase
VIKIKIIGIIPARSGSKGIKDKNIYSLCGKPLIDYTVHETWLSNIDDWCISTDIFNLQGYSSFQLKNVFSRPFELCADESPIISTIVYTIREYEYKNDSHVDVICLLQPTSPLRTREDINNAITLYKSYHSETRDYFNLPIPDSLYSGYYMRIKTKDKLDSKNNPRHFQRNGAIFIASRELIEQGKLWDENVIEFEMPFSRSIDIDTMEDMFIAESLIKNGGLK